MRTIDPHAMVDPVAVSLQSSSEAAETAVRNLLTKRAADATICPSEVARLTAGPEGDWRGAMRQVHAAVDKMHRNGAITLSWKGKPLDDRIGPYRIGRRW